MSADATTRWVWVSDVAAFHRDKIQQVLADAPPVRIAIGTTAPGIEGFRRSYQDAHTTQATMTRLRSPQRVAFFTEVKLIAAITENPQVTDHFIKDTLADFESASPTLRTTLLTFINQQCNAARTAHHLYIHRNTLMRRLESAQRLLPRPLDDTIVHVAVALEALQWRDKQPNGSMQLSSELDR